MRRHHFDATTLPARVQNETKLEVRKGSCRNEPLDDNELVEAAKELKKLLNENSLSIIQSDFDGKKVNTKKVARL